MTPDQKRDAWVRFAAEVAAVGVSLDGGLTTETTTNATLAHHCGAVADALLSEVEQREREGRFGSVDLSNPEGAAAEFRDLTANRDEWMERAQRAEAAVERLRASLALSEEGASTLNDLHDVATERARKAESLLKEALAQLRDAAVLYTPKSIGREDIGSLLARARQEGFSDGE